MEVVALLLPQLQKAHVMIRTELDESLPLINGDRVQLQQVIMNLLQNGCYAMNSIQGRTPQLLIQTHREESDHVRLTVHDNGIGIDPESRNRIFDAFYTTKPGGMGIGLSVSRSIIENHQGRIWAEPIAGTGARFSFSIPLEGGDGVSARTLNQSNTS